MPLEKGQAPLEKGQTYIEHFPAREDALLISHVKSIQTTYCHFDRAATSGKISCPLPNHPPRNPPNQGIPQPHIPRLRPIQIGVGGLLAGQTKHMKSVMHGPFALQRVHGPVPDEAIGMPLTDGGQLALEVLLADFEGGFELDVVR